MYGAMPNEQFSLPAVDLRKVSAKYYRRQVEYHTSARVGTIIVDLGFAPEHKVVQTINSYYNLSIVSLSGIPVIVSAKRGVHFNTASSISR